MNKIILTLIFIFGNALHIWFLKLNEILKIADSFAYLQMSHYLKDFSLEGFGSGWFGFLYSLPIAFIDFFVKNDMLSAFIINILLFNIFLGICYILGKKFLSTKYNTLFLVLLFLSPVLLHYNINILSENIYIPLFMILFLGILNYKENPNFSGSFFLGFMVALLYLTRSEAFIYLGSIGLIIFYLFLSKKISFSKSFLNFITVIISFFIFIFPYLFYLHSITGEWGLTNKGSANLRQAELRGISKMDDDGFEQAVGELTLDNHHLIAGFAGGLKYDKPEKTISMRDYILNNKQEIFNRSIENGQKLYTNNIPNLALGNAQSLYKIEGGKIFYQNKIFLVIISIPLILILYGIFVLIKKGEYYFLFSFFSFFLVAQLFFSLFFILDRYFIIFVPIFIFFMVYGIEKIGTDLKKYIENTKFILFSILLISIYSLGMLSYYNTFKNEDSLYEVKKIAGEWLSKYHGGNITGKTHLKILERFPVVTYYAKTKERWLTPYTSKLEDLVEYARFNNINYLVVDSIDFKKYRKNLLFLLNDNNKKYNGLLKLKEFEQNGEKLILYRIK